MKIDDLRIQRGWLAQGFRGTIDEARLRDWRRAHPEFEPWTVDWFSVECAPDVAGDDFDAGRGTGSSFLFRTRASAEKYAARDEALASGIRPLVPVYFADVSALRPPDVARAEWAARRRRIGEALAALPGCGGFFEGSGVLFAPATDEGAVALGAALAQVDQLQEWAREQEMRLVEEAEGR